MTEVQKSQERTEKRKRGRPRLPYKKERPKKKCEAHARTTGEPCEKWALNGADRCKLHGGQTTLVNSGINHHSFKNGRHSKHLPKEIAGRYEAALNDETLLELGAEIALLDIHIGELLERVSGTESKEAWATLNTQVAELRKALFDGTPDINRIIAAFRVVERTAKAGTGHASTWSQIGNAVDQRRRLVEAERRHADHIDQFVSVQEQMVFAAALLASLKAHTDDRTLIGNVASDFSRLLSVKK